MSGEKPTSRELIAAVIRLFEDELLEQITPPDLKFKALIARNVLQIVERELDQGASSATVEARALRDFGAEGDDAATVLALRRSLSRQIQSGRFDDRISEVARGLTPAALTRLLIDNPRYATLASLKQGIDDDSVG